ncbi:MAG: BolA/IbaG family iron-sulfur metabolism protein [Rhodobacteraceae bacterium]|nr:BolA/IbaG family iron-sulfur metabolism protein [Paracoccaceae bacterium]
MQISDEIHAMLADGFDTSVLEVADTSEGHRGHAGWREGGQTHFRVTITADAFTAMSRLQRHRAIHDCLGKDLIGRIHALELIVNG